MGRTAVRLSTLCWRGVQKNAANTDVLILQKLSIESVSNIQN